MSYDPIPETGIKVPMVRSEGAVAMTASPFRSKVQKIQKIQKKIDFGNGRSISRFQLVGLTDSGQ